MQTYLLHGSTMAKGKPRVYLLHCRPGNMPPTSVGLDVIVFVQSHDMGKAAVDISDLAGYAGREIG